MCGRYALATDSEQVKRRFGLKEAPEVSPRFNVAPGSAMPVILQSDPETAVLARWGLVPFWAKDPKIGYRMINARAESLLAKPAFRRPFASQRCLVPVSGFYEWKTLDEPGRKEKIPYYIRVAGESLFAFAGLYDYWTDVEGRKITTFTIITTEPNEKLEKIHNRMPVILPKDKESEWLGRSGQDTAGLSGLLAPFPSARTETYPVSSAVSNPENDGESLIRRQG